LKNTLTTRIALNTVHSYTKAADHAKLNKHNGSSGQVITHNTSTMK